MEPDLVDTLRANRPLGGLGGCLGASICPEETCTQLPVGLQREVSAFHLWRGQKYPPEMPSKAGILPGGE